MSTASVEASHPLAFVVPGPIDQRTGGYLYDARLVAGLRALGMRVNVIELPGNWPTPDDRARAVAARQLAALADGTQVLIDGLAGAALPRELEHEATRLSLIALVHHPLALESGLSAAEAARFARQERRALAACRQVVCTSASTARALPADYGVPVNALTVAEPGVDPAPLARGSQHEPDACGPSAYSTPGLHLLCVATITPRKGHATLIEALAGVQRRRPDLQWQVALVGSLDRAPDTAADLRAAISAHALDERIRLHGEVDQQRLEEWYDRSDVFVLASRYEGYGMVLTEAIARGLPIVATRGGAIADTAPAAASVLVDVDDVAALSAALESVLGDEQRRHALREGARAAREDLPSWQHTALKVQEAIRAGKRAERAEIHPGEQP